MNRTWIAAFIGVLVSLPVGAQTLTDAQVADAIRIGESGKLGPLVSSCVAHIGMGESMLGSVAGGARQDGGYDVTVSMNTGYIASLAETGKRLYKRLTVDAVSEELRAPMVWV